MPDPKPSTLQPRLDLPKRAVRRLQEVGIYCRTEVRLEHQHLAKRYVVHGIESGGAVRELGRYLTFSGPEGEPLVQLHPVDSIGCSSPFWRLEGQTRLTASTFCTTFSQFPSSDYTRSQVG